jgi:hypothetical protein
MPASRPAHKPLCFAVLSVDGRLGSTLVVTKLGEDDACHVAYVEAQAIRNANQQARVIADKDARPFQCKKDKAKTYGASAN